MSCHLGVRRVIIDGFSTLVCRQDTGEKKPVRLSARFWLTPLRPSLADRLARRRVHGQDTLLMILVENEVRSVRSIYCFFSRALRS